MATVSSGRRTGLPESPQPLESLWRSHFMHQVKVNIQDSVLARGLVYNVGVPDLFEHRFRATFQGTSQRNLAMMAATLIIAKPQTPTPPRRPPRTSPNPPILRHSGPRAGIHPEGWGRSP